MNKTQVLPSSAVQKTASHFSLARRLVLPVLQRMKEGGLSLTLPDGSRQFLGSRDAAVQAEMTIHHDDFFQKVLRFGDIGFGESYVDGDWDTRFLLDWVELARGNELKRLVRGRCLP